jgi:ribosomal protein L19
LILFYFFYLIIEEYIKINPKAKLIYAYEEYLIEHERYKDVQRKIINTHDRKGNMQLYENGDSLELDRKNEIDKYNNRKSLEIWVGHEIERIRVYLENKFGLRKISIDTWITNDGKLHKVKCIKVIKNDTYFYIQCPEIYVKHMELIGYKLEILDNR